MRLEENVRDEPIVTDAERTRWRYDRIERERAEAEKAMREHHERERKARETNHGIDEKHR